ncbi:hypothetical protein Pint_28172 [Pistacia integerrima]|uniref:Uncharacterized protein n=1 Tax=Pistacia integerrima TaxID=434235 RepID=A0ACC0YSC6_9ROSI|nr:hypothetical protein Pint_28172 [Pistacia integerrima]
MKQYKMVMNGGGCGSGSRVHIDVCEGIQVEKLKESAESDAVFLRKLNTTMEAQEKADKLSPSSNFISPSEPFHQGPYNDRFARRQRYLRSYKFSKDEKDTTIGKTMKRLMLKKLKVKEKNNNKTKEGAGAAARSVMKGGVKFLFSCITRVYSRKS